MPTIKITNATVRELDAAEKPIFYWDEALSGFGVKVTPKGKKVYVCQYRPGGGAKTTARRMTIGTHGILTSEQARQAAKRLLAEVAVGADPAAARNRKREEMTVGELCDQYLLAGCGAKKPSTIATDKGRIERHIKPLLGRKKLSDVTRADIKQFLVDVANGKTAADLKTGKHGRARVSGGKGTATRTVGLLGGIFSFACDLEVIEANPVRGIKRFQDRRMERFLSEEEIVALGHALREAEDSGRNRQATNIIRLLILTGARRAEIEKLTWHEVDLPNRVLKLDDSKTGQKVIRLSSPAAQLLSEIPSGTNSNFVFPATRGEGHFTGTPKVWRNIRESVGMPTLRIHDLRHSYASLAAGLGAGLPLIGALLGQKSASTTQRYVHFSNDPLQSMNDGVGNRVANALQLRFPK